MNVLAYARQVVSSRWFIKGIFFFIFVWLCWQLLRFTQWARGYGEFVPRPEAVAGILPIGHFTSFIAWLKGGGWDTLLPAGLVIIIGAIVLSILLKRGFCGWVCPVGTLWEFASALGRKVMGRGNFRPPRWADRSAIGFRYLLTALFFGWLTMVSVEEALWFRELPYMWVADIKIVEGFFEPAFIVIALLAFTVSMLLGPVWCRWLCPLGGLYSVFGLASACTVVRDETKCVDCRKCSRACHAFVDVHTARDVRAVECDGCMDCVRVCPVDDCITPRVARRWRFPVWIWPLAVAGVWFAIWATAELTGNWDTTIPVDTFREVIQSGLLEQRTPGGIF